MVTVNILFSRKHVKAVDFIRKRKKVLHDSVKISSKICIIDDFLILLAPVASFSCSNLPGCERSCQDPLTPEATSAFVAETRKSLNESKFGTTVGGQTGKGP